MALPPWCRDGAADPVTARCSCARNYGFTCGWMRSMLDRGAARQTDGQGAGAAHRLCLTVEAAALTQALSALAEALEGLAQVIEGPLRLAQLLRVGELQLDALAALRARDGVLAFEPSQLLLSLLAAARARDLDGLTAQVEHHFKLLGGSVAPSTMEGGGGTPQGEVAAAAPEAAPSPEAA